MTRKKLTAHILNLAGPELAPQFINANVAQLVLLAMKCNDKSTQLGNDVSLVEMARYGALEVLAEAYADALAGHKTMTSDHLIERRVGQYHTAVAYKFNC